MSSNGVALENGAPEAGLPRTLAVAVLLLSALPFLVTIVVDPVAEWPAETPSRSIAKGFLHTVLVWTALCTALFTVMLALIQYNVRHRVGLSVVGAALFAAACFNGFHVVGARVWLADPARIQGTLADAWLVGRSFVAVAFLVSAGSLLLLRIDTPRHGLKVVLAINTLVAGSAYFTARFIVGGARLPRIRLDGLGIVRPWELVPLALFCACFLVFRAFHRRQPGALTHALKLSMAPAVASHLHMAFGSRVAFDPHFHAAHALEVVQYLTLFAGLAIHYARTYRAEHRTVASLEATRAQLEARTVCLQREIVERQSTEEALARSEGRVRAILDGAPDAILHLDERGNILSANTATAKMFEYSPESLVGRPVCALMPLLFEDGTDLGDYTVPRRDGTEVVARRGDDSVFPADFRASEIPEGGGRSFIGIVRDITLHKASERRLLHQAELLMRSNRELEQYAYVTSHDLKEPLRMVSSYVQLLQRRYGDRLGLEADEFIGFALDGTRRMQNLIDDLLEFARVGSRNQAFAEVDLNQVLDETLEAVRGAAEEAGAIVTRDPLPVMQVDRMQITQLLCNLLSNSIKFRGSEPPRIHVSAERQDSDGWRFAVSDNGVGIEPQHHDRIFAIFQRLHTREEYPGTGIGLAICKKIVERHGGRIGVNSTCGEGTRFWFTLPDAPPDHEDELEEATVAVSS